MRRVEIENCDIRKLAGFERTDLTIQLSLSETLI